MSLYRWGTARHSEWSFVVDTTEYSGNFERELCGYVMGVTDEYGEPRALPFIKLYQAECPKDPMEDLMECRIRGEDNPLQSPVDIAPTPGYENNGMGVHRKLKAGKVAAFPAFQSVAIFLSRRPNKKTLEFLKKRAHAFPEAFRAIALKRGWGSSNVPEILGLRLVEERVDLVVTEL